MISQRNVVYVVFGASIVGALVPSYLHLSEFFSNWLPSGFSALGYVSALVIEASLISGVIGLRIVSPYKSTPKDKYSLYVTAGMAVLASVYVNTSWAIEHSKALTAPSWMAYADVAFSSVFLPIFALATSHSLEVVLRRMDRGSRKTKRRTKGGTKGGTSGAPAQDAAETIASHIREHGETHWRDVRSATGVSRSRIYAAKEAGEISIEKGIVRAA